MVDLRVEVMQVEREEKKAPRVGQMLYVRPKPSVKLKSEICEGPKALVFSSAKRKTNAAARHETEHQT